ncbi:MAG: hypothetical protein HFJ59_07970 [Clostridia bacterium]|nr:hypothetical protein [Clostridia bacterium]
MEQKEKKRIKIDININFTIIAIILLIIFGISLTPVTFQNDTFYTIKIGEYIKNFGIDMMDPFSWHENLNYTYPHWLYDLLTYLIYSTGGFKGIYLVTCILSAILSASIFIVNAKLTKSKSMSFIVTIGALYMLQDYITARAQLVTFILFIWEMFFIEKFLEKRKIIYGIPLILISLFIANLHAATWPFFFILFLPYVAEYLICVLADIVLYNKIKILILKYRIKLLEKRNKKIEKIEKLKEKLSNKQTIASKIKIKREQENINSYKIVMKKNKNVRWLIVIMIISALMGLLTPIGDTPYTYLYKTMQGNTTQNINEHLPMTLANDTNTMSMLIIFLAILIFTKTKIKLSDFFMIAGLCYLMLSTKRQVSMFALIGSIILTRLLIDLITRYSKDGIRQAEKAASHIAIIIALSVLMILLSYDTIKPKLDDEYIDTNSYPVYACDYILENIDLKNARFYNEYNYGSYMLFRGIPVFIDSRADLYSPEFSGNSDEDIFSDFINTSGIGKFYEDTFEKYDITHVICFKKAKMNMIITRTNDKHYKELYSDDRFVVYERINVNEYKTK